MKIICLVENTPGSSGCVWEHGLSFYIETPRHRLLADTGASDLFIRNAGILGVDLSAVDTVILSHGHYDHTGGALAFTEINDRALLYIRREAIGSFFHHYENEERYIGVDPRLFGNPRVRFIQEDTALSSELSLFGNVTARRLWPDGNRQLYVRRGEVFMQDSFDHEQYAVIRSEGKTILISGCAHAGIVNIMEHFVKLHGCPPDAVFSGFHMMGQDPGAPIVSETAEILSQYPTRYYTGHCTGEEAFPYMKKIMGDKLCYVHSGDQVIL